MTITAQTAKSGPYAGNGSTVDFDYGFRVDDQDNLVVTLQDASGTETVQTITTDYTVAGVGVATGGTITMVTAPASGEQLVITRAVGLTQEVDLQNRGAVNPETLELAYDKLTQISQDQQVQLDRAVKVDVFDGTDLDTLVANINSLSAIDSDITTVAGISSDVTSVAADATDIGTVAGISANVTTVAGISADVSTVAADGTDIGTVAGLSTQITALGPISADITTVAGISADVTTVAADGTDIGTVAGISGNVTTVAGISSDVTTVAADGTDIGTVAGLSADIQTLADIEDGTTATNAISGVAAISADVTTVAADGTDIGTVAGISANVTTVAGISANVTTVAGISADVTTVAADGTDIGTVATNISNVNTVAGISGNVTTVAGISADVTTVAADGTDIGTVAGISSAVSTVAGISADVTTVAADGTDIGTVAGISADVTTVATNVTDVTNFANVYVGPSASNPATRSDGSALQAGDLYFNTTDDELFVYTGAAWTQAAFTAGDFVSNGATGTTLQDLIISTASGIDVNPGSDIDADLITVGVTGTPKLYWDESLDGFRIESARLYTNEGITAIGTGGIDVNPGSDTDTDLITVGVTGTPRLYWDEAPDWFRLTKSLTTSVNLRSDGGVLKLGERATAEGDSAGYGQIWVRSDTPNTLMFTDDAGNDEELATLTRTQTLTNKTITSPTISDMTLTGSVVEDIYVVTGTTPAIEPANGTIQTWTLSGNSTPTDSLVAGESVTLMIDDGTGYTITWTSLVDEWIGGSAPTLATTGYSVVALWKVSTTVYANALGDLS